MSTIKISNVCRVLLLCVGLAMAGCYDDSALQKQLQDHESRLKEVERLIAQQNTNISSLQTIVTALQDKDYVTNVSPIKEGDNVVGYTIAFSKSGSVTIYNGKDGASPLIGIKQDRDQMWYWTLDGEWLFDSKGDKVRASAEDGEDGLQGLTPTLKIVDGYWYVSYDGGKTWEDEPLGQATGDDGYTMFSNVTYDENYVYITMSDGEKLTLLRTTFGGETTTRPVALELAEVTAVTATFTGHLGVPASDLPFSQVTIYYSDAATFNINSAESVSATSFDDKQNFTNTLTKLKVGTKYNYCMVAEVRAEKIYGEVLSFTTVSPAIELSLKDNPVKKNYAEFMGSVSGFSPVDKEQIEAGVAYSTVIDELKSERSSKIFIAEFAQDDSFALMSGSLPTETRFYYCFFVKIGEDYTYFDVHEFRTLAPSAYTQASDLDISSATDLSSQASANCYIVSKAGLYKFKTVKGNSETSVGSVASASILWETFGTNVTPRYRDLIGGFCYKDGYIAFQTAGTFTKGNAVIAAKDAEGNVLWSWHIWLTEQPAGQEYYNNAGTMMDRNLGATSAVPGDSGVLGLLYQWGRKDPFLGVYSNRSSGVVRSTVTWPSAVSTGPSTGTVDYATSHPTTFVTGDPSSENDWHYSSRDNSFWTTSDQAKSIFDPCPAGWRVPDGGNSGVWKKALGSGSASYNGVYDNTNRGVNLSGVFGSSDTIWYPGVCSRNDETGNIELIGYGHYWSATPYNYRAHYLLVRTDGMVGAGYFYTRAHGYSVRCVHE